MSRRDATKSPVALRDLQDITLLIRQSQPGAALRFVNAAEKVFEDLALMPGMGRRYGLRGGDLESIRFWPIRGFSNFIIFYLPTEEGIEVVRVLHGARDIPHVFGSDE